MARLDEVLHYVADTEPGSSGSPAFNSDWQAIALCHWGGPWRQVQDAAGQPLPISVNEGIRITAILTKLAAVRPTLSEPVRARIDTVIELGRQSNGEGFTANPTPVPPSVDGYDPNFLPGHRIVLPGLTPELARHAAPNRQARPGADTNARQQVPGFPSGNGRTARMLQRGHLVRRLDPVWGSVDLALAAELDTFHFTNCTPQVGFFNQGTADPATPGGGRLWRAVENYVLRKRSRRTATRPLLHRTDLRHPRPHLPRNPGPRPHRTRLRGSGANRRHSDRPPSALRSPAVRAARATMSGALRTGARLSSPKASSVVRVGFRVIAVGGRLAGERGR